MQITDKKAFRKELIQKRRDYAASGSKAKSDRAVFDNLIKSGITDNVYVILTYISTDFEVDTVRLIEYCLDKKIKVALPRCEDNKMTFYYISSLDELKPDKYNIPAPGKDNIAVNDTELINSLCIVPGLAFTRDNYRIGYGGGYYDRFIKDYKGITAGLCYKEFILPYIPTDSYDLPTRLLITD